MLVLYENENVKIITEKKFPVIVSYSEKFDFQESNWQLIDSFHSEIIFRNPDRSKRLYYRIESNNQKEYGGTRKVKLDGTFNFRDLGGYRGANNKRVVWGKLFRSDALNNLSKADIRTIEGMEINTIIDYRAENEQLRAPDKIINGALYISLNPNAKVAELSTGNIQDDEKKIEALIKEANTENSEELFKLRELDMRHQMGKLANNNFSNKQYRKMFDQLLAGNTPIIMHCKGGKDRAGFGAVLVLMALGVSKEDIVYDYMLTADYMEKRNIGRMEEYRQYTDNKLVLGYLSAIMSTRKTYLDGAFEMIGEDFEDYLIKKIGLTEDEIYKLRDLFLY